ncbi:hypothetical protein AZF37_00740 [endosymbiont 'TC1' of Trimyema compressum]|nr:hypothetical protein AZF37_00740 [endosymbiont 'TC1' of Trimyema compressum]
MAFVAAPFSLIEFISELSSFQLMLLIAAVLIILVCIIICIWRRNKKQRRKTKGGSQKREDAILKIIHKYLCQFYNYPV